MSSTNVNAQPATTSMDIAAQIARSVELAFQAPEIPRHSYHSQNPPNIQIPPLPQVKLAPAQAPVPFPLLNGQLPASLPPLPPGLTGVPIPVKEPEEKKKKNNKASKYRGFLFTLYFDDCTLDWAVKALTAIYDREDKKVCEYLVMGLEKCPTTNKMHLQGFMYFTNPRSWNGVQKDGVGKLGNKIVPFGFLENSDGSPLSNKHYCLKGDQDKEEWSLLKIKGPHYGAGHTAQSKGTTWWEFGECPAQGARTDIAAVVKDIQDKKVLNEYDLFSQHPESAVAMHKGFMRMIRVLRAPRTTFPDVHILYGPPGTGKSLMAYLAGAKFISICGDRKAPFLQGYDGEDCVCFDDIDPEQCSPQWFFKICDRYNFICNTKGDEQPFRATTIYVTTNVHPKYWWPNADADHYLAFERRIKTIITFNQVIGVVQRKPFKQDAELDYTIPDAPKIVLKDIGFATDEETRMILAFREAQKLKTASLNGIE